MNEGYLALYICIVRKVRPEDAFRLLDGQKERVYKTWTVEEFEEIEALKESGATWAEIGEMFGVSKQAAAKRYSWFKNGGKVKHAINRRGRVKR